MDRGLGAPQPGQDLRHHRASASARSTSTPWPSAPRTTPRGRRKRPPASCFSGGRVVPVTRSIPGGAPLKAVAFGILGAPISGNLLYWDNRPLTCSSYGRQARPLGAPLLWRHSIVRSRRHRHQHQRHGGGLVNQPGCREYLDFGHVHGAGRDHRAADGDGDGDQPGGSEQERHEPNHVEPLTSYNAAR